ncbi:hypothetical protein D3C77_339710 [compost metagenome]
MHGPVPVVEEPRTHGEVGEFDALMPLLAPIDLAHRTSPGLGGEHGAEALQKPAIKGGVVGDDQVRLICEAGDLFRINALTGHHGVVDAGNGGDMRWNGIGRLPQSLEGGADCRNSSIAPIGKGRHGEFDDLVDRRVQPRGFDIHEQAPPNQASIRRLDR